MFWKTLINRIKRTFHPPDNKEWLNKLVDHLEQQREEDINLAFRITDVKDKGYIVKVSGLYAFLSFLHMPWKYPDLSSWRVVFPHLTKKVFFGKVHQIRRDPLAITINGEIPQFRQPELEPEQEYCGIIILKTKSGIFIDFGYQFHWQSGAIVSFMQKTKIVSKPFEELEAGEFFQAEYCGIDEMDHYRFRQRAIVPEVIKHPHHEIIPLPIPAPIKELKKEEKVKEKKTKKTKKLRYDDSWFAIENRIEPNLKYKLSQMRVEEELTDQDPGSIAELRNNH
jgi:hypothetical protein